MEEYSINCGFILTANFKNKIIDPLQSRCSVVEFSIPKEERKTLAGEIYSKIVNILNTEKIVFENDVLKQYIIKYFPDFRRTINEIQYKSSSGTLSPDMSDSLDDGKFKDLIGFLKTKNFSEMRKWVANSDVDYPQVFRKLYDTSNTYIKAQSIPQLVLILSKYQYQAPFAADQEINMTACFTEVMADCLFT
jgi:replication factor C small subunit